MHSSSPSIGALAAALAKAQAEITNPEKSLTATIISPFPRESNRNFRYASLAAGLEIIRKSLSRQEIAIFQTTVVDKDASLVKLNTVLAHASGEWMSSQWPVCPAGDVSAPHKMGAALTYARRYALFALVGIAGEDDLDAPDLAANVSDNLGASADTTESSRITSRPARPRPMKKLLPEEESATLRDGLLQEMSLLTQAQELAVWAQRRLPEKNRLITVHAREIERAFEHALVSLETPETLETAAGSNPAVPPDSSRTATKPARAQRIRTTSAPIVKPIRRRDKQHRSFVASQPCLVCGRTPADAHHIKYAQPIALGLKASDEFTVPLCRSHHRELHRVGNEKKFWKQLRIEPLTVADKLWKKSRRISAE